MRSPRFYALSMTVHGLAFLALASAEEVVAPMFGLFEGQAFSANSPSLRARRLVAELDTRVRIPEPSAAEILPDIPSPPPPEESARPSTQAANLDDAGVARLPNSAVVRQRVRRPGNQPVPVFEPEPAEPEPVAPSRLEEPLPPAALPTLPAVEAEALATTEATPQKRAENSALLTKGPATAVEVFEPGNDALNSAAAVAMQGAAVDDLPRRLPRNRQPIYPPELLRRQVSGRVILKVVIDPRGQVKTVEVAETSGQAAFDDAALTAVREWEFTPARRGTQPVEFEFRLPIAFTIRSR